MTTQPSTETAEARQARRAELEQRLESEFRRFKIIEGIATVVGVGACALLYMLDVISYRLMVVLASIAFAGVVAFGLYWLFARLLPLQRELKAVRPRWTNGETG